MYYFICIANIIIYIMRRILLLFFFALGLSSVFAQTLTSGSSRYCFAPSNVGSALDEHHCSVFAKDAVTLASVDFSADNLGYSTGVVTEGPDAHTQTAAFAMWHRWPNIDFTTMAVASSFYTNLADYYFGDANTFVSYLTSYADTTTSSAENGFMMISLYDQRTPNTGTFNAYIRIDSIDASNADIVEVQLFQYYFRPYYDHCYLDYSTDGTNWSSVEINTMGIDYASAGNSLAGIYTYTLPADAAGNDNLSIRIRSFCSDNHPGTLYGYFWLVDDVTVHAGEPNRLRGYRQEYVEGAYGMVPQGLQLNTAWYSQITNTGTLPQNDLTARLFHLGADSADAPTEFATFNNGTLDVNSTNSFIVDNGGWLVRDSLSQRGWYGYRDGTPNGTGTALPTDVAGDNYLFATVSNDNIALTYDTMFYQVTTPDANGFYRWAHDNGVLTYSPYNCWLLGFTLSDGEWRVTEDLEDVRFYNPGYIVSDRFTTGAAVPDGWVIRGVELVASPVEGFHSTGVCISAVLTKDVYSGGSVNLASIPTGASRKVLADADVNDETVIGRYANGYLTAGNYNTVVIDFPEQPALLPNTSYRVGYTMEEEGYFALAQQSTGSYRIASPSRPDRYDTILYFKNSDTTAKYANYFKANNYATFVNDPSYGGEGYSYLFAGNHLDYHPMIRLLVGPAVEMPRASIDVQCEDLSGSGGHAVYNGEEVCGTTVTPVEGTTATIVGVTEMMYVADVLVNGQKVEPYNDLDESGDPNLRVIDDLGMHQTRYEYDFVNVMGHDNEIKFVFRSHGGIQSVDMNVRVSLQPNPATTQVSLHVEGVAGLVQCDILDMSGRMVCSQTLDAATEHTLNLNGLAKGAYFVRVTNDSFSKVEKLIVR